MGNLHSKVSHLGGFMEFWSKVTMVTAVSTTPGDKNLSSVTVAGLPPGALITRVIASINVREIEDASGAQNQVTGITGHIQVDKSGGTFVDAIAMDGGLYIVEANQVVPGTKIWGDIDIKAEVDAEDTYEFRWDSADAVGNSLIVREIQSGLRVYFTQE